MVAARIPHAAVPVVLKPEDTPLREEGLLPPGGLPAALAERTRRALACGALVPIETAQVRVDDGGVRFLVRVVSSLGRKASAGLGSATGARPTINPFLPPEPELTVAPVTRTHLAVLNKFNVLERHLLLITRNFEHQETLLTPADFGALCLCMAALPSLGFYNGGPVAGASQTHKHLQLVPLHFGSEGPSPPIAPLLTGAGPRCPALPFAHAFGRFGVSMGGEPLLAAEAMHALYRNLLTRLGIGAVPRGGQAYQSAPYNLLVTADWMLAVPRTAEHWRGISINALGFAGSLFVKDHAQLELIRAAGPMQVLRTVTGGSKPGAETG